MSTTPAQRPWLPALLIASASWSGLARAQVATPAASVAAINDEYQGEVRKLEKRRLERLGQLAATLAPAQAEAIYEDYFRLAMAKDLYLEAEPTAERLVKAGDTPSSVVWLAHLVDMIAEADRGAFEDSLGHLAAAVRLKQEKPDAANGGAVLPVAARAAVLDAYYQRLVRGGKYDVARKAMRLIADNAETPAVRDLADRRARQLELVGKPAAPLVGVDLDGKPFDLAAAKGDVVLVVFWATWCVPTTQDLPWLESTYAAHKAQGFKVVGVNLDAHPESGVDAKSALPVIRRFLLDYNVSWTNLLNGQGARDYARAFGVAEIPASVLIGRDGKVAQLDLNGPRLEKAVADALGAKP